MDGSIRTNDDYQRSTTRYRGLDHDHGRVLLAQWCAHVRMSRFGTYEPDCICKVAMFYVKDEITDSRIGQFTYDVVTFLLTKCTFVLPDVYARDRCVGFPNKLYILKVENYFQCTYNLVSLRYTLAVNSERVNLTRSGRERSLYITPYVNYWNHSVDYVYFVYCYVYYAMSPFCGICSVLQTGGEARYVRPDAVVRGAGFRATWLRPLEVPRAREDGSLSVATRYPWPGYEHGHVLLARRCGALHPCGFRAHVRMVWYGALRYVYNFVLLILGRLLELILNRTGSNVYKILPSKHANCTDTWPDLNIYDYVLLKLSNEILYMYTIELNGYKLCKFNTCIIESRNDKSRHEGRLIHDTYLSRLKPHSHIHDLEHDPNMIKRSC